MEGRKRNGHTMKPTIHGSQGSLCGSPLDDGDKPHGTHSRKSREIAVIRRWTRDDKVTISVDFLWVFYGDSHGLWWWYFKLAPGSTLNYMLRFNPRGHLM